MRKNFLICLLSVLIILPACSSVKESYETIRQSLFSSVYDSASEIEYPIEFKRALAFLKDKKYKRAEDDVKAYLRRRTDIYWYGHAYLLLAEAQEGRGANEKAVKSYKEAIKYGVGYDSPIMATAMYRLSWLYERTEAYQPLLVLLFDLQKNLKDSDIFVKEIETPARIANVYYVFGLWDKTLAYRSQSTKVLSKLSVAQKEALGSKFFRLKNHLALQAMNHTDKTKPKTAEKLSLVQTDLLDVGEMAPHEMSAQAFHNLEKEYGRLWGQLNTKLKYSTPVEQETINRKKLDKAANFMDLTAELRAARRPGELIKNSQETLNFFKQLSNYEQKVRTYAHNLEIGLRKSEKRNNPKEKSAVPRKEKPLKIPTRINKEFINKQDKNL